MKIAHRLTVFIPLALIGLGGISAAMFSGTADIQGIMTYPGMSIARIETLTLTSLALAAILGIGIFSLLGYRHAYELN